VTKRCGSSVRRFRDDEPGRPSPTVLGCRTLDIPGPFSETISSRTASAPAAELTFRAPPVWASFRATALHTPRRPWTLGLCSRAIPELGLRVSNAILAKSSIGPGNMYVALYFVDCSRTASAGAGLQGHFLSPCAASVIFVRAGSQDGPPKPRRAKIRLQMPPFEQRSRPGFPPDSRSVAAWFKPNTSPKKCPRRVPPSTEVFSAGDSFSFPPGLCGFCAVSGSFPSGASLPGSKPVSRDVGADRSPD